MKKMKKFVGMMLAVMMVLAMSVTAMAATVTVDSELSGHKFAAYQIVKGTVASSSILSNPEWGNGINSSAFLAALKADTEIGTKFTSCSTIDDFVSALAAANSDTALVNRVAKIAYANKSNVKTEIPAGSVEVVVDDGYYLVVDETDIANQDLAANAALLQVVGAINIKKKTDKPTVEKKVKENTKYKLDEGYGEGYNDVADYNMGDSVPFKLIGSVPSMEYYDKYYYEFSDTMSKGLTLDKASIKVYTASNKAGTDKAEVTGWTEAITPNADGTTSFQIKFSDLKSTLNGSTATYILVEYSAVLNKEAVVGRPGNPNEVKLIYSNNPDQSGKGENSPKGETPKDCVIVFTYELDTKKVDGNDKAPLSGAKFKLKNSENKWAVVDSNGKVFSWDTEENATELESGTDGLFKVIGLDAGTYHLKETAAPSPEYNLLKDLVKVEIEADTANSQNWTSGDAKDALIDLIVKADGIKGTTDENFGIGAIEIANNKGGILPETGGRGVKLFYVIGSVLVLGAVVLLVTRRRMNAQK